MKYIKNIDENFTKTQHRLNNVELSADNNSDFISDKKNLVKDILDNQILNIKSEISSLLKTLSENRYNTKLTILLNKVLNQLEQELKKELAKTENF